MSTLRTLCGILLCLAILSQAAAQIDVPDTVADREPLSAKLANPIPEGAQVQGGWSVKPGKWLPAPAGIHIWPAGPGTHTVAFRGIWVKTRPLEIDGETVQVLEGFGFIDESATVTVGEDPGPNPPDPPDPGGKYQIMLFYDADRLDNYPRAQQTLLNSLDLRDQLISDGHYVVAVLESASIAAGVPSRYSKWYDAVRGDPLPRVAIAPREGGKILDADLPADAEQLRQWLNSAQLARWYKGQK